MTPDQVFVLHLSSLRKSWLGRTKLSRDPPMKLVYQAPKNLETIGKVYTSAQLCCGCKFCKPTWTEHFVEVSCEEYDAWRASARSSV